jgi:hypothetical protein
MKRLLVLLALAVPVGCQQPVAPAPVAEPAAPMAQAPPPSPGAEIDFANWPAATDGPFRVDPTVTAACAPFTYPNPKQEAERKRHGPHYWPAIVVRTNPEAIAAFKAGDTPLPVGSTVVKEKHSDHLAKGPPDEYGAMIKREPGYDPAHGDWEYLYVTLKPEKKVTRGRLESCIDCHAHAKDKDYLFRTYLPGQAIEVPGW